VVVPNFLTLIELEARTKEEELQATISKLEENVVSLHEKLAKEESSTQARVLVPGFSNCECFLLMKFIT